MANVKERELCNFKAQLHSIIHRFMLSPCVGTVHSGTRQGTWRSMWRREFQVRPYPSVDRIKEIQFFDVLITEIPAIATVFCGHLVATGPVHVHHGTIPVTCIRSPQPHPSAPADRSCSHGSDFSNFHDTRGVSVERDTNCLLMISTRHCV